MDRCLASSAIAILEVRRRRSTFILFNRIVALLVSGRAFRLLDFTLCGRIEALAP